MTKKKAWRVYGLRFLSGCGKCLNVWKFVRGVVHIGLKIILRGKSERDPAFKMVKWESKKGIWKD